MTEGQLRIVQLNAGSLLEPRWADRRHEIVAWIDGLARSTSITETVASDHFELVVDIVWPDRPAD